MLWVDLTPNESSNCRRPNKSFRFKATWTKAADSGDVVRQSWGGTDLEATSQSRWLKEGDRNTVFFHAKASERQQKKVIKRLKDDMDCVHILNRGTISPQFDFTHVLIPKIPNPETITQFQPISLCNVIYKLVSKTIANLADPSQSPFIPAKQRPPARRPLSPYLYLFCAEAFSASIQRAEGRGQLEGVVVSRLAPRVSHLLFSYDTLIFCQATMETMCCVQNILSQFEAASVYPPDSFGIANSVRKFIGSLGVICRIKSEGGLGFRRLKEYNLALLAKQAWRVAMHPDTLCHQVLRQRYFPGSNFFAATTDCILSIPLKETGSHDEIIWHYEKKGMFSVHSVYALALMLEGVACSRKVTESWRFIWNARVSPKIKLFAWHCGLNTLPTLDNLQRRGIGKEDRCPCCLLELENLSHLLVSCTFFRLVWALSNLPSSLISLDAGKGMVWLQSVHRGLDAQDVALFLSICWGL
ncbi:UNVERIFIED_CONTAM: hypothetical protein Sradi_3831100 [Sesamum radiatum]|uniref:Reverse transcriptase zinc-binding domain-containing protein n=1 Tax=Sesamum radiatum TaxID=300843 RepID=A0AAW2Q0Y2_SESRA